jgi:hypothetical protein
MIRDEFQYIGRPVKTGATYPPDSKGKLKRWHVLVAAVVVALSLCLGMCHAPKQVEQAKQWAAKESLKGA